MPLTYVLLSNAQKNLRTYCQGQNNKEISVPIKTTEHEEHQYEENIKKNILAKALDFVQKTGWSIESLAQGAEAAGYPGVAHGLFPNGGGDLVHYFNITCNEKLVEQMKSVSNSNIFNDHTIDSRCLDNNSFFFLIWTIILKWPKEEIKESKVPAQLIENAIMTRLLMIEPYK